MSSAATAPICNSTAVALPWLARVVIGDGTLFPIRRGFPQLFPQRYALLAGSKSNPLPA
jgi:hypothetical protein